MNKASAQILINRVDRECVLEISSELALATRDEAREFWEASVTEGLAAPVDFNTAPYWLFKKGQPAAIQDWKGLSAALSGTEADHWELSEDGQSYETRCFDSDEAALAYAVEQVNRSNYEPLEKTYWVDVMVKNEATEEVLSETVTLEPDEPDCAKGRAHDWQSPYEVLGGLKENPGVWGHGGGAIIREVCAHCGRYRVIDSWAQRPDTGEQGLTSVTYEDPDEASLNWVAQRKLEQLDELLDEMDGLSGYTAEGESRVLTLDQGIDPETIAGLLQEVIDAKEDLECEFDVWVDQEAVKIDVL